MDAVGELTTIGGPTVVLRPVREDEYGVLAAARADLAGVPAFDEARLRARVASSGRFNDGELLLGIESRAAGRLVGEIQARHPEHALPVGVWEVGIELYDTADRGRGLGSEATALLTAHLFDHRGAHRVQASTGATNGPMRGVLERLGFGFEGVLRGFWPDPGGGACDYAMYGMTKDDYLARKGTDPGRWTSTD